MAHKTLVGGTAYGITGGKCLVGGTGYSIQKGRTLVGGTGYDVSFDRGDPIYVNIEGTGTVWGVTYAYVVINGWQYSGGSMSVEAYRGDVIVCSVCGGTDGLTSGVVVADNKYVLEVEGSSHGKYNYTIPEDANYVDIYIDADSTGGSIEISYG